MILPARAYAVMPFVWSIGTIIGPSIGGCFAHPSENYPALFSPDGFFARFPYLLPNLICASMLVVAIVAGLLAIEDTHPGLQQWQEMSYAVSASVATPLLAGTGTTDVSRSRQSATITRASDSPHRIDPLC